MKRNILAICCLLMATMTFAQQQGGNGQGQRHEFSPERYKQKLEEFVTREAQLTPEEAQRLYPLLHDMLAQQLRNNEAQRQAMRSCGENATEANYQSAVEKVLELDLENKRIEQESYKKFHSVISWKKVYAVRIALWKFQRESLRRFSPNQGNGGQRGGQYQGQRRQHQRPVGNKPN